MVHRPPQVSGEVVMPASIGQLFDRAPKCRPLQPRKSVPAELTATESSVECADVRVLPQVSNPICGWRPRREEYLVRLTAKLSVPYFHKRNTKRRMPSR